MLIPKCQYIRKKNGNLILLASDFSILLNNCSSVHFKDRINSLFSLHCPEIKNPFFFLFKKESKNFTTKRILYFHWRVVVCFCFFYILWILKFKKWCVWGGGGYFMLHMYARTNIIKRKYTISINGNLEKKN